MIKYQQKYQEGESSLRLTGNVFNKLDGSVQMEVQGTEEQINQLLISLSKDRYIRIDNILEKDLEVLPEEKSFICSRGR